MKDSFIKTRLTTIQKICLAGMFTALTAILQKITAINYIPVMPFLRISIGGPAMIIFSSIFLGPWYGLFVGAASDILGYFAFDMSGFGFFPQITAIYALLGFVPYFIFNLIRRIKNKKILSILEGLTMLIFLIGSSLYIGLNDELKLYSSIYEITALTKIMVPVILAILSCALFGIILGLSKKNKDNSFGFDPITISFTCYISEILIMVMFGSIMKGLAFGFQTYLMILISQIIVLFINVVLNTVLISLFSRLTKKYYVGD